MQLIYKETGMVMIVLQFLLFAFWLTIFPWGIGLNFNRWYVGDRKLPWYKTIIFGLMTELVIFQIFAIVLTFMKSSLTLLTALWVGCCIILIILGIWGRISYRKSVVSRRSRKSKRKKYSLKSQWENIFVALVVIVLIAFQVVFVTLHVHEDLDDAWYVGTAVVSYFTDVTTPTDYFCTVRIKPVIDEFRNGRLRHSQTLLDTHGAHECGGQKISSSLRNSTTRQCGS